MMINEISLFVQRNTEQPFIKKISLSKLEFDEILASRVFKKFDLMVIFLTYNDPYTNLNLQ